MNPQGRFLTRRLGRRIFLMFALAALVPAAVVFWLTYDTASDSARASQASALRASNKQSALGVFERLKLAQATLERMDPAGDAPGQAGAAGPILAGLHATAGAQAARLAAGEADALLTLAPGEGGRDAAPRVELTVRSTATGRPVTAVLDPAFLWGGPDQAPQDGQACVYSGDTRLHCAGGVAVRDMDHPVRDEWELFLKPAFGAPSWRFVAWTPAGAGFSGYGSLLLPLGIGLLLLALLLSSVEIRRVLVPLDALLMRIRAVGGPGGHDGPARVDEFAMLDQAFTVMEGRIAHQLATLETLQRVDRLILDRKPVSEVVALVLARIQDLVGSGPVALSLSEPGDDGGPRHFIAAASGASPALLAIADPVGGMRAGDLGPVAGDAAGAMPDAAEADPDRAQGAPRAPAMDAGGEWRVVEGVGPGFEGLPVDAVAVLGVGQAPGAMVRVAIGQAGPGHEPDAGSDIRELAGRVAVAMTAAEHENRLLFQARHDLLTGLPNRLSVLERLADMLGDDGRAATPFATMFIDLDRFKAINDGLGHGLGDAVLVEVSRRLATAAGADAHVARLGGDEFFLVLPGVASSQAALEVDRTLRDALAVPVHAGSQALAMDFSAGIAMHPGDGSDPESLIHHADLAMYRAKRAGGGQTLFFADDMDSAAIDRIRMETDLRAALRDGELYLHYQPRVDSRDGRITGVEALARWSHPTRGQVPPNVFIAVAEECGLMEALGAFVIGEACRQLAAWKRAGLVVPVMAVNVSTHQLQPGNVAEIIGAALDAYGLAWQDLEVEITESMAIRDAESATSQLRQLREAGCSIAIDDFGTGFSSLAYLARLPSDTIKIDKAFVQTLHEPETQVVVRAIIAMARALQKNVIAEGVESLEDVALLNAWGCFVIQGYVYFRPLPAGELAQHLETEQQD